MGEFLPKTHITGDWYLNFSDAMPNIPVDYTWGYDWGTLAGSDCSEPEVCNIPENRACSQLYRIRMTVSLKAGERKAFCLSVCR